MGRMGKYDHEFICNFLNWRRGQKLRDRLPKKYSKIGEMQNLCHLWKEHVQFCQKSGLSSTHVHRNAWCPDLAGLTPSFRLSPPGRGHRSWHHKTEGWVLAPVSWSWVSRSLHMKYHTPQPPWELSGDKIAKCYWKVRLVETCAAFMIALAFLVIKVMPAYMSLGLWSAGMLYIRGFKIRQRPGKSTFLEGLALCNQ